MAIWQYKLSLFSKDLVENCNKFKKGNHLLMQENSFSKKIPLEEVEKELSFIEKKENTWGDDEIFTYGNIDDNDIKVYLNKNTNDVEGVAIRYSLRVNDIEFLDNIIKLAKKLDCYFIDNNGNIIKPNKPDLAKAILNSNAFRFVQNPKKFIDDLAKTPK